jgi:AcrR family transcriptional regulator
MTRKNTKKAILDAAELLFARNGYKNTSLRSITAAAKVNLAAVNYHFGTKNALLNEVFSRRLLPINRERMEGLKGIEARCRDSGEKPSTAEIMRAFMMPVLRFRQSSDGGGYFAVLVGRALTEADPTVRGVFAAQMKAVFSLSFRLLCTALPHLPPALVFYRFNFALGAMSRGMCLAEDTPLLPDEGVRIDGTGEGLSAMLFDFVASGMESS